MGLKAHLKITQTVILASEFLRTYPRLLLTSGQMAPSARATTRCHTAAMNTTPENATGVRDRSLNRSVHDALPATHPIFIRWSPRRVRRQITRPDARKCVERPPSCGDFFNRNVEGDR
jgi:hypothetical protein